MRVVAVIARVLLGLAFTVFGANLILMSLYDKPFLPMPKDISPAAAAFNQALANTKFMQPLAGFAQFVPGLLLLTGFMVPLGLTLLAPVIVTILLFHLCIDPHGIEMAFVVLALELFLAVAYGPSFRGVLQPFAKPRWGRGQAAAP